MGPEARIIEVGGGASTLVDDLLARGYQHLTLLDISAQALAVVRTHLGEQGKSIAWVVADVTKADLPKAAYDVWHNPRALPFSHDPRRPPALL